MVCKKDVLTWFKGLKSYKRTDLMCSLLNLCLPVELRFLGTCLEHLGKRDFHELRQAETEANNRGDLNSTESLCLTSQQLRTKLAVYISVLYSCNYACSNSIYKILTKTEDVEVLLKATADDENALDDLLLVYMLAINHPAFSFEQKLNLEKIFHRLHEEETRLEDNDTTKTYSPTPQEQDKTQNIPGYPACISLEDGHIIGVGPQLPNIPPTPHLTDQSTGVISVHDGGGNGSLRLSFQPGAPVPPTPAPLILNTGGWTVIQPTTPVTGGNSPMASRTSSPCSRPGSPSPPSQMPPQQSQRLKFPPPRVPPPGDIVRDTIGKEMPKYAIQLQNFTSEQLSRMTDDELKDIGLTPCAIVQLRTIISTKPVIMTNGVGPPPILHPNLLDNSKKKMDEDNMMRRYPLEAMTVYHPIPNAGMIPPSQCYSCYTLGPRKCLPIHHYPHNITLGPPPPPPTTLPHIHQTHAAMRNLRLDEHSSASDTASDHSPPDTPAPQQDGAASVAEDRLSSNQEERRGGGNSGRGRGVGRNRSNPPGIQTLPRGRGPNPSHRRRDAMMNGVDDRKMYQPSNGSNQVNSSGNGSDPPAPSGYFTSYISPYMRPAYPAAYHHPAAYVRHAYPTAYHNGDLVYQYPAGPPPGTSAGTFLPPPPPPPAYSPIAPQQPPTPSQVMKSTSCYNCGSQFHLASECIDPTIEEVTKQGQYRIDFANNFPKQPGDLPASDK